MIIKRLAIIAIAIAFCGVGFIGQSFALSSADRQSLDGDSIYYWPDQTGSCSSSAATSGGAITPVSSSVDEMQNAEAVMGVAKTEGLAESAALVALMTSLDESGLTNDANTNVPLSEQNPNKQGDGSSGTSLGIFQQQITANWSTISSSVSDPNAINQLMTPAYAAEAFFGGAQGQPSALSKGLRNVSDWQSLAPKVAAQEVQNPSPNGTPDAGDINYQNAVEREQAPAQSLLDQYWNSAPAVPLPVPLSGNGTTPTTGSTNGGSCVSSVVCNSAPTAATASSVSQVRQNIVCIAQQELQAWKSGQLKPSTNAFYKYSNGRSEAWCADFASWVYNQAGDPLGPSGSNGSSWDVPYVGNMTAPPQDSSKFTYHSLSSGYTPQAGDLALHGTAHVNIVISVSGSTITLIGGDQGGSQPPANIVSEYSLNDPTSDNPPITGYLSPNQ